MPSDSDNFDKVQAFSKGFPGRSLVLTSSVLVYPAFDPAVDTPLDGAKFMAVWDTGATNTAISPRVAEKLGLKPIRMDWVHHADGKTLANVHLVNLGLPNRVGFVAIPVTELRLHGSDLLIGMDIISQGDLAVTCYHGKTQFTYRTPSCETIDFVKTPPPQYKSPRPAIPKVSRNALCPCGSGKKYKNCHGRNL